ncbi:MAG: hypothetical protein JWQ17_6438 [Tardiphaga sp.]|jgi:hypothetical protein|nr:hypothetical protein [Tardiphaga sp.]
MTAIAKVFALAFPAASVEAEILKLIAIFCGVGLLLSLCLAAFGLNLGAIIF